jgi:DNA-binding SARP family transcriptional activator
MARLSIHLLGPMQVTLDSQAVTRFETEKARALLAYLAVEADRPHRRDLLAELLWPERPAGAAGANLRHTLAALRRAIGDTPAAPGVGDQAVQPFLIVTRQTIQFNSASDAWVDTHTLLGLLHTTLPSGEQSIKSLEEAAALCRGAFLEDLSVTDCAALEEWLLLTREHLGRLAIETLHRLAERCEQIGDFRQALEHARRQVGLEPWDEQAQRQVMRLLAFAGQRNAALAQYETCRSVLADALGLEPETETTLLFQRIRDGRLEIPVRAREPLPAFGLPRFVLEESEEAPPPLFVARERELVRLAGFLDQALTGKGCVVLVAGGPGQGKTALLGEFVRRSMDAHADLLIARGDCAAYSGAGDPYLPFRDVMAMLTGDLEARWLAGSIGRDHARRLWKALPLVVPTLLASGSSLIGTLLDGDALLSRVALAMPDRAGWLERFRALAGPARTRAVDLEQGFLFEQVVGVLRALAVRHPLALVLDDVQWADRASIGLLFHLGRRLVQPGNRVLIVCAYRPEEIALGRGSEHHPLQKVLNEFRRLFGDVCVDLDEADRREGRSFVDAFIDSEPNRLGEDFRAALFHRTAGHALFTIELLRAMQERGDIIRDEADGAWIHGPRLDWEALPARVEAAIEERVNRLEPRLRKIAGAASVEGELFTAQVLAAVQKRAEKPLLQDLMSLERMHGLVREQGEAQAGSRRTVRFRFSHILVQEYLYRCLSRRERRLLHGQVAAALESLHEGHLDEIAVQLAYHFLKADDYSQAHRYSTLAAESAARRYAHEEAIKLYTQAIELAPRLALNTAALADLHRKRGLAYETLGNFEAARTDHETALRAGQIAGEHRVEWRALLDLAKLWTSRDYGSSRSFVDRAMESARNMGDPALLAASLNWVGNWHLNAENLVDAIGYHQQALEIAERLGDQGEMASTLDRLGLASVIRGDPTASVGYYDRAIVLFRQLNDRPGLASSLTGRGLAGSGAYTSLTLVSPALPVDARRDLEEALSITRETDSPSAESWALWSLSLLHTGQGQFGRALEAVHSALGIASAIGHREWMAGSRSILGALYVELFAPEEGRAQLRQALALSERLRSRHWIHHATGAMAAACLLLNDLAQTQTCLDSVLSPEAAMNTMHRRTCWARRAELALLQGQAPLALEIADRLIASAPGMAPGQVIPFLWKLKAEALAAAGRAEEAGSLLQAAVQHAQAAGERFLLWRIHASLGRLQSTMDRQPEAEEEFSTARELVGELADTIPGQGLRDSFLQRAYGMMTPSA